MRQRGQHNERGGHPLLLTPATPPAHLLLWDKECSMLQVADGEYFAQNQCCPVDYFSWALPFRNYKKKNIFLKVQSFVF